jgi:predicted  nucleic acid-binding Zn-ribbon protein
MTARNPTLGHCRPCGHVWPLVWTPIDMSAAGRLMKSGCPACGERKLIFMATSEQATAWREGPRGEPCFVKDGARP